MDFSYISKVENDRIPPPAGDTIERICRFLSVPSEPLLALSQKIPAEVAGALAASPGAVGFLRKAAVASLTEAEWERLTCTLDRLRRPGGEQELEAGLPESMRDLFWDHRFEDVSWPADRDFVIARILGAGDWDSVTWLRERVEPDQLRQWLIRRRCRGLDARRIRLGADPRPACGPGGEGCGGAGRGLGTEDKGSTWHPESLSPAQRAVVGQLAPPLSEKGVPASPQWRRGPLDPVQRLEGCGVGGGMVRAKGERGCLLLWRAIIQDAEHRYDNPGQTIARPSNLLKVRTTFSGLRTAVIVALGGLVFSMPDHP